MRKLGSGPAIFVISAVLIIAISIALDVRRRAEAAADARPRFSGSAIVADMPSLLPAARLPSRVRVAIVRDDAAAKYYDSPASLDSIIEAWRVQLIAIGADARVVRSNAISGERAANVLVIPSSPCLTIETREAIEAAKARGQGLIITGLAGMYDAGCRRIGYGLIVGNTGATRAELLGSRAMVYAALPAGSPLAADIPPGARIELNPAQQVALRHRAPDAYYSDYALQPQPASDQPLLDAAIVRATRGSSRIVYWGFELHNVFPRDWNRSIVRLLVRNSVAWAGRVPLGWVEPWPDGKRAAAAFAQDVEYQFTNARYAADSLRAIGVPSTYFVTSKYAKHYKRITRQLAEAGEIGTHTENHRRLGGTPADVQQDRLNTSQRQLKRLLGSRVAGLRPPEEQFDTATMAAWLKAGGQYLFGVNDSRVAAPEMLRFGSDTLVLFSRVVADDLAMISSGIEPGAEVFTTQFLNDLAQIRALGGLYLLSYHSQLLARPELVSVVARVARAAAADSAIWIGTTGDIAEWWRTRAALRVETSVHGRNALAVNVRNRGTDSIRGAVVRVVMPEARRVIGANTKLLASDAGMVRLALPEIPGSSTRSFLIMLEPRKSDKEVDRARSAPRPRVQRKAPWWQFWKHLR
jgi:peptidoglycan/xylan/chitin deacetylase (PgdA/CDA1 family)